MADALSSVRIRTSLYHDLHVTAAELAQERDMQITMRSLLEEGIEGLSEQTLEEWIQWAAEGRALVNADETSSKPFRIRSDLSKRLGVQAARISQGSPVPVTKIQLLEEAGRRIIGQVRRERDDLQAVLNGDGDSDQVSEASAS